MFILYGLLQQPSAPHIQTSGTHTDPGNGPAQFNEYEALAKNKEAFSLAKDGFKQTMGQISDLNEELKDLGKVCDYLMRNFDKRQEARTAEMDALNEATAILSGMN